MSGVCTLEQAAARRRAVVSERFPSAAHRPPHGTSRTAITFFCLVLLCGLSLSAAEEQADTDTPSRTIYKDFVDFKLVPDELKAEVKETLEKPTFFLSKVKFEFQTKPAIYSFLLDNIPISASLARALRVESYSVVEEAPQRYYATDGAGLMGNVWLLSKEANGGYCYGRGTYDGSIVGRVSGSVFVIATWEETESGGVRNNLYIYIRVHSAALRAAAKALKPLLNAVANRKLKTFLESVECLAVTLHSDPNKAYWALVNMGGVPWAQVEVFKKAYHVPR